MQCHKRNPLFAMQPNMHGGNKPAKKSWVPPPQWCREENHLMDWVNARTIDIESNKNVCWVRKLSRSRKMLTSLEPGMRGLIIPGMQLWRLQNLLNRADQARHSKLHDTSEEGARMQPKLSAMTKDRSLFARTLDVQNVYRRAYFT